MTKEEARDKYGSDDLFSKGYVWCYNCPIKTKCDSKGMTGFDDCWEKIAEEMSKQDDKMSANDKRMLIGDYCAETGCPMCKLKVGGWDKPLRSSDEKSCLDISRATNNDLDRALSIINKSNDTKPTENDVIKPEGSINPNPVPVDLVNHPPHYTHGGMECIDEMILIFGRDTVMNFCLCNAWKYRKRAPFKGTPEQDMDKSDWYINKYKELALQKEHDYGWEFK